jgi:hypothetical protein
VVREITALDRVELLEL